jgi:hypothetical protein
MERQWTEPVEKKDDKQDTKGKLIHYKEEKASRWEGKRPARGEGS